MNNTSLPATLPAPFSLALNNIAAAFVAFVPQLLGAIVVVGIGLLLSSWFKVLIKELFHALNLNRWLKHSTFKEFVDRTDLPVKMEEVVGEIGRWLILYIFTIAALNVVGLTTVSEILSGLLNIIPHVISATFIFMMGVLLAGLAESVVKGALAPIDIASARLAGKIVSYLVVTLGSLIAISELGIGEQFILIIFIGFVAMIALGFGLALGLGSADLVKEIVFHWYHRFKKPRQFE